MKDMLATAIVAVAYSFRCRLHFQFPSWSRPMLSAIAPGVLVLLLNASSGLADPPQHAWFSKCLPSLKCRALLSKCRRSMSSIEPLMKHVPGQRFSWLTAIMLCLRC